MFEHMKNFDALLRKVCSWLRPSTVENPDDSLLFVDIFCHRTTPYDFTSSDSEESSVEDESENEKITEKGREAKKKDKAGDWMSDMFFSGGTMPSHDMLVCLSPIPNSSS